MNGCQYHHCLQSMAVSDGAALLDMNNNAVFSFLANLRFLK